ncbi:MAG TPA: crosslink repair DNA glycosylase YcaQ family protein, partial [Solirubrobacteraceae bacterium]|nr:crosslink repair DNA glycosylase YcaQ family protein [Solirubrobacteraceae bacterium]
AAARRGRLGRTHTRRQGGAGGLTAAETRRHRLRAQRLTGRRDADPVAAVSHVFGIQAQDRRAALLAVRARTEGATAETVEAALRAGAERAARGAKRASRGAKRASRGARADGLVRTWAMRGTLHLLTADDLPAVLAIFGPIHLARGQRRLTQLGVAPAAAERSTELTAEILRAEGPLTRHELAARLHDRGVPVAAEGQAPIHVVARAAHAGVLIEVEENRYGPLDLGPLPDREEALVNLARRYAAAHAPATIEDFAAWSGLPKSDLRWEEPETGDADEGGVRLLPAFDEWLLGWKSRDPVLPRKHAKQVAPGGGIIRPVAIADGRVFATWRLDRPKRRIVLDPFGRVTKQQREGVEAEVDAIADFLGVGHRL